jgi:hypothetical protein
MLKKIMEGFKTIFLPMWLICKHHNDSFQWHMGFHDGAQGGDKERW